MCPRRAQLYGTTKLDTWKVQAAMTTELDYGVGNITAALKAAGLWEDTLLLLASDNGGACACIEFHQRKDHGADFRGE